MNAPMAGAANDVLQARVAEWLGEPVQAVVPLGVAAYNAHYRVEAASGRYHLVRYFNTGERALGGIRFEHAVVTHLERHGFTRLPRLVERAGRTLFRMGDDHFALTVWIDGCATEVDRPVTPAQLAATGRTVAALHRAMAGFGERLAYLPEHVFVYPADEVRRRADALIENLAGLAADPNAPHFDAAGRATLAAWLPTVGPRLERFPWALYDDVRAECPGTPLVHGDIRLLNLVFAGDEVAAVLDFNASFNELRLWDLAYGALSLAGTETVGVVSHPERAQTFLAAYDAAYPLSAAERRLLPHFLEFTVLKLLLAMPTAAGLRARLPLLADLDDGLAAACCAPVL